MLAWLLAILLLSSGIVPGLEHHALAANQPKQLSERLTGIRAQVMSLEEQLISSLKTQREAKNNIKKIQVLMHLQQMEKDLGRKRLQELERTIGELESRRGVLNERIGVHQRSIRQALAEIHRSAGRSPGTMYITEAEKIEAPRRKVLANMAERGLKEIEMLRADLADADQLESKIQEEQHHLAYLTQDLQEQESVLELNRQLQVELIKKKHAERISQLENYRKLKSAETHVEELIQQFNARIELEQSIETERIASRSMMQGAFAKLKGRLSLPVMAGKVVSQFGRFFDSNSNLYVFKKGIDIDAGKSRPVQAVSAGKLAYSGELPNYGRVAIVDHGDHFYSLCAHLGELNKKVGDSVAMGDVIGLTDDQGTPVYFEIRARNVAVNPLQWISN